MALTQCPECHKEVSTAAAACPGCGHPIRPTVIQQEPAFVSQPPAQSWNPGVAAVLSLVIPGAGQMYKGQIGNGIVWLIVVVIGYAMLIVPGLVLHLLCIFGAASGSSNK